MRAFDFERMEDYIPAWKAQLNPGSIVLLSADGAERQKIESFFPNAQITSFAKQDWDLDKKHDGEWDLAWTSFTFMCASDPPLWIENILSSVPNLWILDLIEGWRGGPGGIECAVQDNDVMRYHLPGHRALWPVAFDLGSLGSRLKDYRVYPADNSSRTFAAWVTR